MGIYLNPGNAGFASIRRDQYVDKSGMISLMNRSIGTPRRLTCVSRPRRFGKSYAAKMLCAYYDKSCHSQQLFEDLKIAGDETYKEFLNHYNVIYLDISGFVSKIRSGGGDIREIVSMITENVVSELKVSFPYVKYGYDFSGRAMPLSDAIMAVTENTGEQFIFIIDEWDAVFREAVSRKDVQDAYMNFLRDLFKNGNVTDTAVAAAYMTGILPIKKYGHQSAISDFQEYSMTDPGEYASYVGFTEDEVKKILESGVLPFEEMKSWYDGYSFPTVPSVYNPNSVMMAIRRGRFGSYWTRTETYESLKIYIDMNFDGLRDAIIALMAGGRQKIDTGTFQNDMTSFTCADDVLTLLIHLGYLGYDADRQEVFMPNREVLQEFVTVTRAGQWDEIVRSVDESDKMLRAVWNMDEDTVAEGMRRAHLETSHIQYNDENALSYTVSLAFYSARQFYTIIREMPSGEGVADIVFLPRRKYADKPAMIIELKWNHSVKSAIDQIYDRNYPASLAHYTGDLLLVGINYDRKTKEHSCRIEKMKFEG